MDPLSITCSTVALLQAASSATSSVYKLVQSLCTVDVRLSSLCDELNRLSSSLRAIDNTISTCRGPDLALVEDKLWQQVELALGDCRATLYELEALVGRITETTRARPFGWRARAVIDMGVHGDTLTMLRDRLQKSNSALQTMLHTITVSLCLKMSDSQDKILWELDGLKSSIDEAIRLSFQPSGGLLPATGDQSDVRVARNLRNLAEAARQFHSAASSTASTIHGGSTRAGSWCDPRDAAMSMRGDLPPFRRERVETFIREGQHHTESPALFAPRPSLTPPRPAVALERLVVPEREPSGPDDEDDEAEDIELECLFLDGLEELARERIRSQDFARAVTFLVEALKLKAELAPRYTKFHHMEVLLALCYFFQGDWRRAEPIVLRLAASRPDQDLVVCNLLHSLALARLAEFSFDSALDFCRQALHIKKRLLKGQHSPAGEREYGTTFGLLATIYDMKSDYIRAEVYRKKLPAGFIYVHPASEAEFLAQHPSLLPTVLGGDVPDLAPLHVNLAGPHELDSGMDGHMLPSDDSSAGPMFDRRVSTASRISPLKLKHDQWERFERDTSKEVVCDEPPDSAICLDADDDDEDAGQDAGDGDAEGEIPPAAPSPGTPGSPLRRGLTVLLRSWKPQAATSPAGSPGSSTSGEFPPVRRSDTTRWARGNSLFRRRKSSPRAHEGAGEADGTARRASLRRPGSFKLLRMERVTLQSLADASDGTGRQVKRISLVPASPPAAGDDGHDDGIMHPARARASSGAPGEGTLAEALLARRQALCTSDSDPVDGGEPCAGSTQPAEAAAAFMPPAPSLPRPPSLPAELPCHAASPVPRPPAPTPSRQCATDAADSARRGGPRLEFDGWRPGGSLPYEYWEISPYEARVAAVLGIDDADDDKPAGAGRAAAASPGPPPSDPHEVLGEIAAAMASLATRDDDAAGRLAARLRLEALARRLGGVSDDPLVRGDVDRVIASLGGRPGRADAAAAGGAGDRAGLGRPLGGRPVPLLKLPAAAVRRRFSWTAGSESAFLARPGAGPERLRPGLGHGDEAACSPAEGVTQVQRRSTAQGLSAWAGPGDEQR